MQKISSIEFLRFFSSLMILVWHYQQFYLPYNFFSETEIFFNDKTIQPFFKYIKLLYTHGNYGVDFFFIISGYVFAHVYLIKKKIKYIPPIHCEEDLHIIKVGSKYFIFSNIENPVEVKPDTDSKYEFKKVIL